MKVTRNRAYAFRVSIDLVFKNHITHHMQSACNHIRIRVVGFENREQFRLAMLLAILTKTYENSSLRQYE